MNRRGDGLGIAGIDFFMTLVMVLSVLLTLSLIVINPESAASKQDHVKSDALFLIRMNWSGESKDDVDMYVQDPANHLVYFRRLQDGLMSLDRDDTGSGANTITLPDGRIVKSENNEEKVEIRGIIEGEYIVNLHLYSKSSEGPTKVEVTLFKVSEGEDLEIHRKVVTLTRGGEEATAFRFTLTKDKQVADINELPKKFVGSLND